MDINLLKKLRGKYRLVQTAKNDFLWEKKTRVWKYEWWDQAQVGTHEYGYYYKSRSEAIKAFIKAMHDRYRTSDYKRKKIFVL